MGFRDVLPVERILVVIEQLELRQPRRAGRVVNELPVAVDDRYRHATLVFADDRSIGYPLGDRRPGGPAGPGTCRTRRLIRRGQKRNQRLTLYPCGWRQAGEVEQ